MFVQSCGWVPRDARSLGFLGTEGAEAMHLIGTGGSCWARQWHIGLTLTCDSCDPREFI